MHKLTCTLALLLLCSITVPAQTDNTTRAGELLNQARAAIGGDKLKSLQSLTVSGSYRQMLGEREMAGDIELHFLLPDKYLKETLYSPVQGMEITRIEAVNGEQAWNDMQNSNTGGGNIFIRQGGPGGSPGNNQASQQNFLRADHARLLLGMLLLSSPSYPLEFSYAGEAESPDGLADILDVKGPQGFSARLFLDQKTHRPLMLSFMGRQPRVMMRTVTSGARPNQEEMEKQARESRERAEQEPQVEVRLSFSDYQQVGGIHFPHRISRSIADRTTDEWELKKFKVNPALKPDRFDKK